MKTLPSSIKLKAYIRIDSEYKGKSKFPFFMDLKAGDHITIIYHLKSTSKYGDMFAPEIRLQKFTKADIHFDTTAGKLLRYLSNIDYTEI